MHRLFSQFSHLLLILALSVMPLNTMASDDQGQPEAGCHSTMAEMDSATETDQSDRGCCCEQCDQDCSGCSMTSGMVSLFTYTPDEQAFMLYKMFVESALSRSSPPHTPPPLTYLI